LVISYRELLDKGEYHEILNASVTTYCITYSIYFLTSNRIKDSLWAKFIFFLYVIFISLNSV
jgi:hypothetical protein